MIAVIQDKGYVQLLLSRVASFNFAPKLGGVRWNCDFMTEKISTLYRSPKRTCFFLFMLAVAVCFPSSVFAAKEWPASGLRGVTTKLVAKVVANSQDPGAFLSEKTFQELSNWGVNLIRVEIELDDPLRAANREPAGLSSTSVGEDGVSPYQLHLRGLESTLALAEKYRIYVLLIATNVTGRNSGLLYGKDGAEGYYTHLIQLWAYIAKRYGSNPWLIGFDPLGEPHTPSEIEYWRKRVLPDVIKAIRREDRETYIIIESVPWGLPGEYERLDPINDSRLVYSFHFYAPHNYTHQGVGTKRVHTRGQLTYPGELQMFDASPKLWWDKDQLRKNVASVRAFQEKHQVRILVGEFGVARWAPGAATWLSDAVSIFEDYGWSWCFLGLGGWNGWNPTYGPNDLSNNETWGNQDTDRLMVLKRAWSRNRK